MIVTGIARSEIFTAPSLASWLKLDDPPTARQNVPCGRRVVPSPPPPANLSVNTCGESHALDSD